jgi:hypothetical protein
MALFGISWANTFVYSVPFDTPVFRALKPQVTLKAALTALSTHKHLNFNFFISSHLAAVFS